MAVYSSMKTVHDSLFGSTNLETREYSQFVAEARTIGDSLRYPGSKISWCPGKTPSYDINHGSEFLGWQIPFQGTVRKVKDWTPGFVANAAKCSTNAREWSLTLLLNLEMAPTDEKCFEAAKRAFLAQKDIYASEYETSRKERDRTASKNYAAAASNLGRFINKATILSHVKHLTDAQEVLKPEDMDTLVALKQKVFIEKRQQWYFDVLECKAPTELENKFLDLMKQTPAPRVLIEQTHAPQVNNLRNSENPFE